MINYVTIIGGFLYAATIIILQSYCIFTFPGYYIDGSFDAFYEWFDNIGEPLFNTINGVWVSFTWISTIITIVAVYWLVQ